MWSWSAMFPWRCTKSLREWMASEGSWKNKGGKCECLYLSQVSSLWWMVAVVVNHTLGDHVMWGVFEVASYPGSPPPLLIFSLRMSTRREGESLGGFDHMRTLMRRSVSTLHDLIDLVPRLSPSRRNKGRGEPGYETSEIDQIMQRGHWTHHQCPHVIKPSQALSLPSSGHAQKKILIKEGESSGMRLYLRCYCVVWGRRRLTFGN